MNMQSYDVLILLQHLVRGFKLKMHKLIGFGRIELIMWSTSDRGGALWFFQMKFKCVVVYIYSRRSQCIRRTIPHHNFIACLQKSVLQFRVATTFQFIYYGKLNICFVKTKNFFFQGDHFTQKKALRDKINAFKILQKHAWKCLMWHACIMYIVLDIGSMAGCLDCEMQLQVNCMHAWQILKENEGKKSRGKG